MTDYFELAELADRILAISDDDIETLVDVLDTLEEEMKEELLHSDFLNAFQVFYYYFRERPTELGEERLILEPATALGGGVMFEEQDLFELVIRVEDRLPQVLVTDGSTVLASFSGRSAYRDAVRFAEEEAI